MSKYDDVEFDEVNDYDDEFEEKGGRYNYNYDENDYEYDDGDSDEDSYEEY